MRRDRPPYNGPIICGTCGGALALIVLTALGGCRSPLSPLERWARGGWVADYDTAEARLSRTGGPLLIHYMDPDPQNPRTLERALSTGEVKAMTRDFVRCHLFKSYEPDRRYVAQFGVQRAPALIVVHEDGTYHARSGPMSSDEIVQFISSAEPPGLSPRLDPYIPRRPRYAWIDSLEEARRLSRETGRPALIVYYRSLSDDWAKLNALLDRTEVARHARHMVHCAVGIFAWSVDSYITPFGAVALPAVVVVHPNGTHAAFKRPPSADALARFLAEARRIDQPAPAAPVAGATGRDATAGGN